MMVARRFSVSDFDSNADRFEAYEQLCDDLEEQLEAAKQRELELLAVIKEIRAMPAPVDPKVSLDKPIFDQWVAINALCDSALNNESQALREHEAKVLEEAADCFAGGGLGGMSPEDTLRSMAEERRKK